MFWFKFLFTIYLNFPLFCFFSGGFGHPGWDGPPRGRSHRQLDEGSSQPGRWLSLWGRVHHQQSKASSHSRVEKENNSHTLQEWLVICDWYPSERGKSLLFFFVSSNDIMVNRIRGPDILWDLSSWAICCLFILDLELNIEGEPLPQTNEADVLPPPV